MSDSILILPSSYVKTHDLDQQKLIDDTPYYKRAKELIDLLLEIGAVVFNPSTGIFEFNSFAASMPRGNVNVFVGRLLGYIAEGIVVRDCNQDSNANKRWANIARVLREEPNFYMNVLKKIFYEPFLENPDRYKAIGTGFIKTAKDYGHLFSPLSDRDICWISEFNDAKELLSVQGVKLNKRTNAGLQIKASIKSTALYVTNYFCKKKYYDIYPVVYFDLGNDFDETRQNLLDLRAGKINSNKMSEESILSSKISFDGFSDSDIIEVMLTRGKDVDPSLHDELQFYKHTLNELALDKINLFDLSDDNVIISLITEYLARKNCELINSQQASILTLAI